jgi:ABC-2 type transport system permease protein
MAVLMISVMIGGQYLLTTTVEEKSSRVVEVLLSALSPMQLMTGKILGQLCVGLTILLIYSSVGGGALILYGLADLIGLVPLIYMIVFFLIAYVTVGALMAAVGSAVNDMREAQSLQGPVMITLIIPYMLWFPISRDPNSLFATIISFLPPVNPFVMMLRITSTEPPPTWQVLLSILVGLLGVYVAVWAAAKVFRIGLLMFGKPPNLVTLVRWVRMA